MTRKRRKSAFLRNREARRELERRRAEIEKEINASRRVEITAGRTVTINDREFHGPCVVMFEPQIRWVSLDTIKEE